MLLLKVFDGERGSEHRQQLLPSYKAHRKKFSRYMSPSRKIAMSHLRRSLQVIRYVLKKCNVPVGLPYCIPAFHSIGYWKSSVLFWTLSVCLSCESDHLIICMGMFHVPSTSAAELNYAMNIHMNCTLLIPLHDPLLLAVCEDFRVQIL